MTINITPVNTIASINYMRNGNFINNSTNGYGSTPDDWINSSANPVQGGFPSMTKAETISLLGINDGDIEGLWNLTEASGNALDLSSNAYNLTDNNTVSVDSDGLMGTARQFVSANSESFSIADASCPSLEISGNQTWVAFVKPTSLVASARFMAKFNNGGAFHAMGIQNTAGQVGFYMSGLATNTSVISDVAIENAKWNMIVGIYNGSTLTIWVNGIKKSVTATGTAGDTNAPFCLGCDTSGAANAQANFLNGTQQNCMVLSVALTDDQVKDLWNFTTYKGIKIRRATTNANLYQSSTSSDRNIFNYLKGRTVTLSAKMWQTVASTGQIDIYDGSHYTSAVIATTGAWVSVSVTATLSSTALTIAPAVQCNTSDGTVWFKEVMFCESGVPLPYSPSADDWNRFPRLLEENPPLLYVAKPYQYEEKRWYTFTPTLTFSGGTADPTITSSGYKWFYSGTQMTFTAWTYAANFGTGARTSYTITLPAYSFTSNTEREYLPGYNANATTYTFNVTVIAATGTSAPSVVVSGTNGQAWESYLRGAYQIA